MSASSGASDDLEDGEIFDDDEPVEVFKGGGVAEKPIQHEPPPSEPIFKIKGIPGCGDRKKAKDKRSSSNEQRDKRNDRGNNRNQPGGGKRKRGRDSEDDHRQQNKNKQRKPNEKNKAKEQPIDEEVDENEMVYVMGGNSPTSSKPVEWEDFTDEEDQERDRENDRGGGGRGRRGREGFHSAGRMSRRARLGRGGGSNKRNRFSRKQTNDQAICKFFLQGKCQRIRGNDCPYSHGAMPSKKMELCKFYMNDCCTKRDKCMYMHGDFPCKFYHTGQKCYAGKRCKFYHGKISNFLRSVLMKHLENRELQNEFDKYREQYEKKDRNRGRDRFNDRRPSRSDDEGDGGSTPMPSPQKDEFASDRERSPTPEREREKRERRRRRKLRRSREDEEQHKQRGEYHEEKDEYYDEEQARDNEYDMWQDSGDQQYNYGNEGNYVENEYSNEDAIEEEQDPNQIPPNLPKAQRKLFMRIQQHNKKPDERRKEDNTREDDFKEDNWYSSDEENGNNNPLNTIFQNVPGLNPMQQPVPLMNAPIPPPHLQQPMMNNQCPPMNQPPIPLMATMLPQPMVPLPNMFDNIDLSAVTKILSTVRESIQKKNNEPGRPMGQQGPMGGAGGPMGGVGGPMGGPGGPMSGPGGPMGSPGGPMGGPGGPMGGPGGPMGAPSGPFGGPIGGPGGPLSGPMGKPPEPPSSSPQHNPHSDERRFRDPRLRGQDTTMERKLAINKPLLPGPVLLTQADLDLRLSEPPPQQSAQGSDVDLRHLPFKPAPLHQAANEIEASLSSGPPIEYKLSILKPFKPDYASIASRSNPQACANDPRLRKYATPQVLAQSQMVVAQALPSGGARMMSPPQGSQALSPPHNSQSNTKSEEVTVVSRDPRNRSGVANDPRRRAQNVSAMPMQQPFGNVGPQPFSNIRPPLLAQQSPFGNPPPFGDQQSHHQDNDFRLGFVSQMPQQNPFVLQNMTDVDLRIQQPPFYQ